MSTPRIVAKFEPQNPKDILIKLEMTQSLSDWKSLASQIASTGWPSWKVREMINDLVSRMEKQLTSTHIPERDE